MNKLHKKYGGSTLYHYRGIISEPWQCTRIMIIPLLVGGLNHLEKYQSMGMIITYIMEKENVPNHQPGDDP